MKSLNLSHCEDSLGLSLQLAGQRCGQLECLDLSHTKLPRDLTLTSLPALSNLTSLSFSFSSVTNQQVRIRNTIIYKSSYQGFSNRNIAKKKLPKILHAVVASRHDTRLPRIDFHQWIILITLIPLQLSVCGVYMSRLTSLDISYCRSVTDQGLMSLLTARDHSGARDPRFGQCRGLVSLLVAGCQNISPAVSVRQSGHLHVEG